MIQTIKVSRSFAWDNELTGPIGSVLKMFGVSLEKLKTRPIVHECEIDVRPGDVCYFTGPSGSGKSVLLREIFSKLDEADRVWLDDVELEDDKTLIDCFDGDVLGGLRSLSKAGLNDVYTVLTRPSQLSEGQKYRYKLARALAGGRKYVFADEFCSNLDRITAAVISHNIRKYANRYGVVFFCASAHDDLLADLRPDVLVIKHLAGPTEVIYKDNDRAIQQGGEADEGKQRKGSKMQCC